LAAAKSALRHDARFVFARRVVTRPADAALEDHDSVSDDEFAARCARGEFALSWSAHGLQYGIPAAIADELGAGRVVVINGSRGVVASAQLRYPGTAVLLVDAKPAIRARRLAGRGREDAAAIAARLEREVDFALPGMITLDNSGDLEASVRRFVDVLVSFAD
jgi:phosphonate metabolism protein PhnN/1,5-bisphosphokinase (PRPP-forming)